MVKKILKEEFTGAENVNGGSVIPDPVIPGDPHAGRAADNLGQSEADVVQAPGIGPIPRAAMLQAIVQMLAGMSDVDIQQIVDLSGMDIMAAPASGVPDQLTAAAQSSVQGSVPMKEDIDDIFVGGDYSDDFKKRAATIFEAAVNTRVAVEREFIKEQNDAATEEKIQELTGVLASALDKQTSYIAEQKFNEMKSNINESVESIVAQQFMLEMFNVVKKYNVNIPERSLDVVGSLEKQIETLKENVNALNEKCITLTEENTNYKRSVYTEQLSESMTPLQKAKFKEGLNNVSFTNFDDFSEKAKILAETTKIEKKPNNSLLTEAQTSNGIPPLESSVTILNNSQNNSITKSALDKVFGVS